MVALAPAAAPRATSFLLFGSWTRSGGRICLLSAGLLSAGLLSAGLLSAGLLSAGLLSAGLLSAGLLSAGRERGCRR